MGDVQVANSQLPYLFDLTPHLFFPLRIQEQRLFEDAVYFEIIFLKPLPVIGHLQWLQFTYYDQNLSGYCFRV